MGDCRKKIYLTVDDGPSCYMTEKVDFLMEKGIPSIWYCRGEYIEKNLKELVNSVKRGVVIGNHSFSHPCFSEISFDEAKREIFKTELLIEKAYAQAERSRLYKLFRFPFLDKGAGKNRLPPYKEQEEEKVENLQNFLRSQGFQKARFEGVSYRYYQKARLGRHLDAPWTFDAKEYALFSRKSMEKHRLHTTEDFIERMFSYDPENGLGISCADSNEIVLFHDFEQTHFLFYPMIKSLINRDIIFAMPEISY